MGSKSSKAAPKVQVKVEVKEVETESAKRMRRMLTCDAFEMYKNEDNLWTYQQAQGFFSTVLSRNITHDEWAAMRSSVEMRPDQPWSGLDKEGLCSMFEAERIDVTPFYTQLRQVAQQLEEERCVRSKVEEVNRRLVSRNEALQDRIAGMKQRMMKAGHFSTTSSVASFRSEAQSLDGSECADRDPVHTPSRRRPSHINAETHTLNRQI